MKLVSIANKEVVLEQSSYGSSKEDPIIVKEKSEDSMDSRKETISIEFEDKSRPSSKRYRDISVGMSQIDISESEQESPSQKHSSSSESSYIFCLINAI